MAGGMLCHFCRAAVGEGALPAPCLQAGVMLSSRASWHSFFICGSRLKVLKSFKSKCYDDLWVGFYGHVEVKNWELKERHNLCELHVA